MSVYDDQSDGGGSGDLLEAEQAQANDAPAATDDSLKSQESADSGGFYRPEAGGKKGGSRLKQLTKNMSGGKKAGLVAGGAAGGTFLIVVLLIMMFLASIKSVHFAKILSTSTFAAFQLSLRERTTQNLFDAATVEGSGTIKLEKRSLSDRLRRINPEKQLEKLGTEDRFKFNVDKSSFLDRTDGFKGITVEGKEISLDKIAQDHGFGSWKEANSLKNAGKVRDRMSIKAEFTDQAQLAVNDSLKLESRSVRSSVFDGIRQESGIGMERWKQGARKFLGKEAKEAFAESQVESLEKVSSDPVAGLDPTVEEAAKKSNEVLGETIVDGGGDVPGVVENSIVKGTEQSSLSKVTSSVSMVVLVSTLACMVNQAVNKLPEATEANQDAAKRLGHQVTTTSDQIQSGDTTAEAVNADAHRWDDAELSKAYQNDANNKTVDYPAGYATPASLTPTISPELVKIAKIVSSPSNLSGFGAVLPGSIKKDIDKNFCGFMLHPAGQITIAAVEIVGQAILATGSGGAVTAGEETVVLSFSAALKQSLGGAVRVLATKESGQQILGFTAVQLALDLSVKLLGGLSYSGAETGPTLYEDSRAGLDALANENARQSTYGRPLTPQESAAVDTEAQLAIRQKNQSLPWTERYFASNNPYSLVSMASASTPSSLGSAFGKFGSWVGTFGHSLNFSSLFGRSILAHAETSTIDHHGVVQHGYSIEERNKLRSDVSYSAANNEQWINDHGGIETLTKELDIDGCFTAKKETDIPTNGKCTSDNLKTDKAFRYRLYKGLDETTVGMLEQDLTPTSTADATNTTGSPGDCPTSTVPIDQTTVVQGIRVHTCIASKLDAMLTAAKGDGITLDGGGWRDNAQQIALRIAHGCGGARLYDHSCKGSPPTAVPGTSQHERGLAVDFRCNGGGRMSSGSPCFAWLAKNAATYGFSNLPSESWHWSTTGH